MRFNFTMIVVVAATLATAARSNVSRTDSGTFRGDPPFRREIEGRKGRAHSRDFLLPQDNADGLQRRSPDAYFRRHPRDFPRREPEPSVAVYNESRAVSRRHPRDFARREAHEGDVGIRSTPGRIHSRQFRSLD
ncbi:hypothetical protein B0H19DRAFT_563200 [Mycena capillaripes]|nr:hypothetical protein B0H19DRAFT_563200 [Mycena capillaripes]